MINEQDQHSELTSRIIGCAMTVHKILANGFHEVIYQRALEKEFIINGISFQLGEQSLIFKRLTNHKFNQSKSPN